MVIYGFIGTFFQWFVSYIYFGFFGVLSEKLQFHFKINYLASILKQESAYFDKHNPDAMVSAMNMQVKDIASAFGEKMAMIIKSIGMCFFGVLLALIIGWKFACAAVVFTPFYWFILKFMGKYMTEFYVKSTAAFEKSGAFSSQALSAIKLVAAFGRERDEHKSFTSHLDEVRDTSISNKLKSAFWFAAFNFINLFSYVYSFTIGNIFVWSKVWNEVYGRVYTPGDV
jgi:ATP-binding cassette, subfamily B (MDR/TAP), member 1